MFIEAWIDNPFLGNPAQGRKKPIRLFLNFEMHRRSDGRKMMVSTAEKTITGMSVEEAGLIPQLYRLAREGDSTAAPKAP